MLSRVSTRGPLYSFGTLGALIGGSTCLSRVASKTESAALNSLVEGREATEALLLGADARAVGRVRCCLLTSVNPSVSRENFDPDLGSVVLKLLIV